MNDLDKSISDFKVSDKLLDSLNILLIYPPVRLTQHPLYPPYGLLNIAAVLREAGANVEILDLNMDRLPISKLKEELKRRKFDIIGTGGMATVYYYMKFLAGFIKKEYPNVPIIGGGTACSGSPDVVIEKTKFDAIVFGEGEPVIIDLVYSIINNKDLSNIPGIAYKNDKGEIIKTKDRPRMLNLGEIPLPAYDLIDMEKYISNAFIYKNQKNNVIEARIKALNLDKTKAYRPIMIFAKRGCPFECTFCYRNFGRKVISLSVQNILDHMTFLEEKYNSINFVFGDETFNVDKHWVIELCDRLIAEKRNYILGVGNGLRANLIDNELISKMKEAGFCSVSVGIESFHNPTLKEMNKKQTAETIANAITCINENGLRLMSAQMMFGFSSDSRESMKENIRMCMKLNLKHPSFSVPCPYPGTYLYEKAISNNYIEDEEGWLMELADKDISDRVINMSGMSEKELKMIIAKGKNTVKMYFKRKEKPIYGSVVTVFQYLGSFLNLDFYEMLVTVIEGVKNFVTYGRLPGSLTKKGGTNDSYIKNEVIAYLKK